MSLVLIGLVAIIVAIVILCFALKPKCPDCGGVMYYFMHDATVDRAVYKCKKCGKEWI